MTYQPRNDCLKWLCEDVYTRIWINDINPFSEIIISLDPALSFKLFHTIFHCDVHNFYIYYLISGTLSLSLYLFIYFSGLDIFSNCVLFWLQWIPKELSLLQNLIDRANEKGWRKEYPLVCLILISKALILNFVNAYFWLTSQSSP